MMLTMSRPEPLHRQLERGTVHCADDQVSSFLPESLIRDTITRHNIQASLPWSSWISTLVLFDSLVDKVHSQARKVFAILSLIGQEHTISDLIYKDNITDDDLPLVYRRPNDSVLVPKNTPKGEPGKEFTSFASWDERRVRDFLERQWQVLAPVLDVAGKALDLDKRCPLPIQEIERNVVEGRGVFVHKASLHPAHQLWSDQGTVGIKEILEEAVFDREKENLEQIKNLEHPHLIKVLASCKKGSFRCFIFPWAEGGNLWDFWAREDESRRTISFVLWMLNQVDGIIDAIRILHERNIRHGDIKPQNILHFTQPNDQGQEEGWGSLVLADVGVSKFHKNDTLKRNAATGTFDVTVLYEAPEAESDIKLGQPRSRRYDMWSAGCMLLEFIVWLLYGFSAVKTFRIRRKASKDDPTTAKGNFFRQKKGEVKIHSMVTKVMELLRADPRCAKGTALAELLDMIENRLLRIDPMDRAEAPELRNKLGELVAKSNRDPSFLWKSLDTPIATPRFFVKKQRQNSDSSVASSASGSSSGSAASTGSSGSSGSMRQPSTGGSLESVDSLIPTRR